MKPLKDIEEVIRTKLQARADTTLHDHVLERVRQAYHHDEQATPVLCQPAGRRPIMKSPITKLAVAAAVVLAVVLGLFEFIDTGSTSGVVWAQVAERLQTSVGMTAQMRCTHLQAGLNQPVEWKAAIYSDPERGYRMETFQGGAPGMTFICNNAEKKVLILKHSAKQYSLTEMSGEMQAEVAQKQAGAMNPKAIVEQLLSGQYTELGRETIDGVEAEGVEIHDPPEDKGNSRIDSHVIRLWVSVETEYPVRMESEIVGDGGNLRATQVVDQFEWHVDLDPDLFQLDVPSDYAETTGPQF